MRWNREGNIINRFHITSILCEYVFYKIIPNIQGKEHQIKIKGEKKLLKIKKKKKVRTTLNRKLVWGWNNKIMWESNTEKRFLMLTCKNKVTDGTSTCETAFHSSSDLFK